MISDQSSASPYKVELHVNGHPLTMEVYTGAGVTLAPESMISPLLSSTLLKKSHTVLKSYTGQEIPVKGSLSVSVDYGGQHYKDLKLLVVEGSGPSLMGRDWLRVVKLNWKMIGKIASSEGTAESHMSALQDKYQEVRWRPFHPTRLS